MYPWLIYWAPSLHFPLSGGVAQNYEPITNWFSELIEEDAGDAEIEKNAFQIASYGRQLGLITEVLIELAEQTTPTSDNGKESLERLTIIRNEIEQLKISEANQLLDEIQNGIERLRHRSPQDYRKLQQKISAQLSDEKSR